MRKLSVLIAGLALTFSLHAGDFKRFYPANAGERIVSLTTLPGGGLWLKSQVEKGGGEINRVLIPSLHRVYRIPDGLTPLAAAAESGILLQQGEKLYFRSLVQSSTFLVYPNIKFEATGPLDIFDGTSLLYKKPEGEVCIARLSGEGINDTSICGINQFEHNADPVSTINRDSFFLSAKGDFVFRTIGGTDLNYLEPADSGKTLIEWGQTAQIGWAVTSVSRNLPLAPPRRLIKIFSAVDGTQLANTQIDREAPVKGLALAFNVTQSGPEALVVISGAGLSWWAPKAEHLDNWGEVTLNIATVKQAEISPANLN